MTPRTTRHASLLVAALTIVAIASAAGLSSLLPYATTGPDARVDLQPPPPVNIMSTLRRACFNCHSADTRWPWYSALPIASWIVERDVTEARGQLNFSDWTEYNAFDRADMLDKVCALATSGRMPPWPYRLLHPEARLSEAEAGELCAWAEREAERLVRDGS